MFCILAGIVAVAESGLRFSTTLERARLWAGITILWPFLLVLLLHFSALYAGFLKTLLGKLGPGKGSTFRFTLPVQVQPISDPSIPVPVAGRAGS